MRKIFVTIIALLAFLFGQCGDSTYLSPGISNPIVPGYFADPSIKKFGDTYYLYATTDGVMFASGEPVVWVSKDFVNWYSIELDIKYNTSTVWAPDVVQGPDGRYYYYYSNCDNGCNIYGYVADNPIGPWKPLNDDFSPVVPDGLVENVISLDGQFLVDSQNNYWIFFCTWAKNRNSGMGWAKVNSDMKSFSDKGKIPNTQLEGVFEGSYVIEKDNKYYATYSAGWCHDETYRVQYGTSYKPNGTYTYGANNPILSSSADLTIHGPGHHSILKDNDEYYIIYHRHDNPQSTGGMFRQVCADHLYFNPDGSIKKVEPTHKGIGYLRPNQNKAENLVYCKQVKASSFYTQPIKNFAYKPEFAVDDNNGTQWKAADVSLGQWIEVDLGSQQDIKRVLTQFEYATFYYQYKIEVSNDEKEWTVFTDRTANRRSGSPMVDEGSARARYLKLTFTGTEKPGMFASVWNIKVYNQITGFNLVANRESLEGPAEIYKPEQIIDFDALGLNKGDIDQIRNKGTLSGTFKAMGQRPVKVENIYGIEAVVFDSNYMVLDNKCPDTLSWNLPFTYSSWVINPEIADGECVFKWAERSGIMATYAAAYFGKNRSYGAVAHWDYPDMGFDGGLPDANHWHNITITFDGMTERVYVDGQLNAIEQKNLFIIPGGEITVGFSGEPNEYFTGAVARIQLFNRFFNTEEVKLLFKNADFNPDYSLPGFNFR